MPGFGWNPFGDSPFGLEDYGEEVFWNSLPRRIRAIDLATDEQYYRKFWKAFEKSYNILAGKVIDSVKQNFPLEVVGKQTQSIALYSTEEVVDDYWGKCVILKVVMDEDISSVGINWKVKINQTKYRVVRTRTRNEPEARNEIWIQGVKPTPDIISGNDYDFERPSLLKYLVKNINIEIDEYDSEFSQRGVAEHGLKLLDIKGMDKSYIFRADYSGWIADVYGLWKITDGYADLVPDEYTVDSTRGYYSIIPPLMVNFDDIPGDTSFTDPDVGATYLLDQAFIYDELTGDGLSPAKYFSQNVLIADPATSLFVTASSVTALTPSELDTYSLPYGCVVELGMTQAQRDKLGYISNGIFLLVDTSTGEEYYIYDEVSFDSGTNTWTVIVDEPPSHYPVNGNDFNIKYLPKIDSSCRYCRSYYMYLVATAKLDFDPIDSYSAAVNRLIYKLNQFKPIHAKFLKVKLVIPTVVEVSIEATGVIS